MLPLAFIEPAKTSSPISFFTGRDSPLKSDSSTSLLPDTTLPSTAIRSPGLIRTISSIKIAPTGLIFSVFPTSTNATFGCSCCKELDADNEDFLLEASRYRPIRITKIKLTTVSK